VAEFCNSIGTQAARALGQLAGWRRGRRSPVERNVGALGWKLTPEDLTEIDRITREP